MVHKIFLFLLPNFWCWCNHIINAQSASNLFIEKCHPCENVPNQIMNITIVPKTFNAGRQLVDIHIFSPVPIGNQLRARMAIESRVVLAGKTHWQNLVTFEDDFCRIIEVYVGELGYEVEDSMGIPRKVCPIQKGHYHAINHTIDYAKFRIQSLPFGKLRVIFQFLEKPKKTAIMCIIIIVSNSG